MIGIVDVEIQSANPQMPLHPMRAYLNSPSSVRVRNVPRKVGTWQITSVQLVAAYPDNSIKTADCKLIGSVWVGTIAGSSTTGTSDNGYTIFASGTDENGNAVSNYVLGKGLVEILETDGTITPGVDTAYVHLFEAEPETPKDGDVWPADGGYVIWQDGEAHALGGGFTPTEAQLAAMNSGVTSDTVAKADAALSRAEAEAGFTEWTVSPSGEGYFSWQISWTNGEWVATNPNMGTKTMSGDSAHDPSATSLQFDGLVEDVPYTATRTRLPTMADVNAKLDKADVVTPSLDVAIGKAADAQKTALGLNLLNQGKADASALPYALSAAEVIAEGTTDEPNDTITYGLADRTINGISTPSGKKYVNIVMPAVSVAGHARDLVVRLAVGAADLNITWGVDDVGGVAVDYETEDGEFPDLSAVGTYLVRLTETAAFAAGTEGAVDVPAKFLIQCQPLQTAAAGGAA